ncbi:hypothetical protein P4555_07535 [Peribacillus frigoritolerans]|uniref:hypothetical protein n=1 Tax=Peribacillus frigoritolerans TaxID=450367 RepID=UPI002E1C1DF0|nr:hypothetical protein [Peribacillus frigoritolerans]
MERKVRDSCGKCESKGDPAGAKAPRRLTDRPRKASAWSGNQRFKFYKQKNCSQTRFSSNISPVSLGVPIGLILNHDFKTRLDYSSSVFLIGWKKFATLLPNYWLAETPQPLGEEAWQTVGGKGADF